MSISGVNNNSYTSYSQYGKLASGNAIQSAADNAAGLAISEQMKRQETGLDVGANNQAAARDLLNVKDGALGSITDSLQRMRELALQAQNSVTVTDQDRSSIQKEIDQLKQNISDIAGNTSYNTKRLLDGSQENLNVATDSNGNGVKVSGQANATLDALGLTDFDVTKNNFNIDAIDNALSKVSDMRSAGGAETNRLSAGVRVNNYSSQLTTASRSRIQDLDIPQAISNLKKQQTLNEYQMAMQRKKQEDERQSNSRLFGTI